MAQVTYYVALPFRQIDGEITAGEPQECRDAFKARSAAAILASDPNNRGAMASLGSKIQRSGNSTAP